MAHGRDWRETSDRASARDAEGRAGRDSLTGVAAAGALLLAAVAFWGCLAASKAKPEVVGVEHRTVVSGDGVVDVEGAERSGSEDPAAEASAGTTGGPETATAALPAEPAAAAPSILDQPRPTFEPEPTLRVVDVRGAADDSGSRLVVQLSRAPEKSHPFELDKPTRCVVDLSAPTAQPEGARTIETGIAAAPRVRIGQYPDRIRLVFEVDGAAGGGCDLAVDETAVVLSAGNAPSVSTATDHWQAPNSPAGAVAHAAWMLASRSAGSPEGTAVAGDPASPPAPAEAANTEIAAAPEALPPEDDAAASSAPVPPAERRPLDDRGDEPLVASPPPAPAPDPYLDPGAAPRPVRQYNGARVSLEFKDADILNVLRIIADVAHRNIVATDDVQGRVTIVLYDVPWDQALDILLKSTGLEMVEYDDVITISTSKRLEEERKARLAAANAGRELEALQTAYLRVNYVKPADLARLLRGGDTTSAAGAAAVASIAGTSADSAGQRSSLLSSRGAVLVNEATSTLIVRDIADGILNARELVRRLDVQTDQVAIQGLIFEADTNLTQNLGIRWGANYIASPETGNPTGLNFPGRIGVGGSGPITSGTGSGSGSGGGSGGGGSGGGDGAAAPILVDFPAAGIQPGSGSTLGLLLGSLDGSATLDAQITALENAGKGKVISRPKVITINNAEAQIQSLEILRVRLPSTGTVINTGAGGTAGGQTVATQAIDTGIILRVTPQVSADGYVLMQIFVKSSIPSNQSTDEIPNEISRQATSQVLVRDGETVVIGGVYRQRAATAESGVPWLRSIPVFGWLFKNMTKDDNRQELLVFITPKVVWRTGRKELPTAQELWETRDRSAYRILSNPEGQREASPIEAVP
jgi:type IV pilus assembly protein PilQ